MALSKKQELFCIEHLVDLNATQAYKRAGYSVKSDNAAAVEASKLLRNPKIDSRIKELMDARSQRTEITADFVLKELYAIARARGSDFAQVVEEPIISNGKGFKNQYIPITMLMVGTVINAITNLPNINAAVILGGMISGLASTGLYQAMRNLIEKDGKKEDSDNDK